MSDLEAKVRITVENHTKQGFDSAAADADKAAEKMRSSGDNAAKGFKAAIDSMHETMRNLHADVKAGFEAAGNQAQQASEKVRAEVGKIGSGLSGLTKLLAGLATADFAKSVLDTADAMQSINSQVRQVTSSETEYLAVQQQLLDTANRTRASLESTANLYVSTSRALKDYGYTQQEILKFTEATNNAMTIGGVGAQQQAAALMQLSQALGSGVLQGDEFKSISEAAPILLDTIAEYMGKSRDEIKKLGSEGKLTADVIFKAISGASEKFGEQAAKMPVTMGQALTVFSNNWQSMVSKLLNDSGTMSGIAAVIKLIADNLNLVVPIVAGFAVAVAAAVAPTLALNLALLANPFGIIAVAIGTVVGLIAKFGDEIDVFGGGWSNLSDVIRAVWQIITETVGEAVGTVKSWFDGLTGRLNEGAGGWPSLFGRVMSVISSAIGAYVNVYINIFATGWMLIKEAANDMPQFFANLGKAIGNVFISAIERMINKAVGMINSMIDFANKAASMAGISGIGKLNKVRMGRGHERTQAKNEGKRENQRRKDAPNVMEMLQDGGKNVWQEAQQQMGQAFTAMLARAQNFRQAMNGFFKSMGQTFIQEMVTKPLTGLMRRMVQESAIYKMIFGTKETLETAAAAKTAATKATETTAVVSSNAVQAASGAAASQAHIPYVGPILAVAAMAAMMSAVMGLMGGGGGSQTTTTTTRIPSAAGGWDIPAGINPLTQLHENEMVLPAEHAQTIREMADQQGGGSTVIINSTGGDFIHKNDLAKLLKQMKRDFKFV
ncbi:TPA: tape measure protein [Neisseria gonorrhoeae]